MIIDICFYSFSSLLVLSALAVVFSKNPVHSVLFLITSFFMTAGLFVLIGAEFLAFLLVIVYVGAVAVLFLFVVMMLDVDFTTIKRQITQHIPLGLVLGGVLLYEFFMLYAAAFEDVREVRIPAKTEPHNTEQLGQVLYTEYIVAFQMAGIILLIAMVGAIMLTLRHNPRTLRQDIAAQVSRDPKNVLKVQKVTPRTGI